MKELIYNKAIKDKLMDLYIQNLKKSVDIIDSIIPIIWQFDGKVYNARLENKLKELLTEGKEVKDKIYPHVELNYSRVKIELNFYNQRSISSDTCNYYLPEGLETINLVYNYSDFKNYGSREENLKYFDSGCDDKVYFYIDKNYNTRIKSAKIVDLLLEKQKELKEKIATLKSESQQVEDYASKLNELKEKLDLLDSAIPCEIKYIYGIKTYANFY